MAQVFGESVSRESLAVDLFGVFVLSSRPELVSLLLTLGANDATIKCLERAEKLRA